jgi:hypothetical protein
MAWAADEGKVFSWSRAGHPSFRLPHQDCQIDLQHLLFVHVRHFRRQRCRLGDMIMPGEFFAVVAVMVPWSVMDGADSLPPAFSLLGARG